MRIIFFWLVLNVSFKGFSQNLEPLKTSSTILEKPLNVDGFNSRYGIKKNKLIKEHENLELTHFAEPLYGNPDLVDATNPLRLLLFYKEFQIAILTDNQLNTTEKIDFKSLPNLQIKWIGMATQNQLWFYDELSMKLGLCQIKTKEIKWKTAPIINVKQWINRYNYVYFYTNENVLFKINQNGNIAELAQIKNAEQIRIINHEMVLYLTQNKLFILNLNTKKAIELKTYSIYIEDFYVNDTILTIFTNRKIINYKLNLI